MIYLIFSHAGLAEALPDIIADKATLWINDDILTDEQSAQLSAGHIAVNLLPEFVKPSDEKSVVAALELVEQASEKEVEILVEYN
jgi:hypothetical protein